MKWVRLFEASYTLDTSESCIKVTASQYKKLNFIYPIWYKSENRKIYVDIDYLLALRKKEMDEYYASCDLFYFITEDMNIKQWKLSEVLAEKSESFKDKRSWNSFMRSYLFSEPIKKFSSKISLRQEFYRIASKLKEDCEWNKATIKS